MNQPKFCVDCKYLSNRDCTHPSIGLDLVYGKPKTEYASVMRLVQSPCKPEALLFEPQEAVIYDLADLFPAPAFPNLERIWRVSQKFQIQNPKSQINSKSQIQNSKLETLLHKTVKKVRRVS